MQTDSIPYCCGVCLFYDWDDEDNWHDEPSDNAMLELIKEAMDDDKPGMCYQAWFRRPSNFEGSHSEFYDHQELKDAIKAFPGCIELPETKNPNSGNYIQGYVWYKQS